MTKKPAKRKRAAKKPAPYEPPFAPGAELGWIIEGDQVYWSGCGLKKDSFTRVRADALRFARKLDAEAVKEKLFPELGFALRAVPYSGVAAAAQ